MTTYADDFDYEAAVRFWRPDWYSHMVKTGYGGWVAFVVTRSDRFVSSGPDKQSAWRQAMDATVEFMERHRDAASYLERLTWNEGDLEMKR